MKIAVLAGGVIGVTTAYYLARSGHEVELIERRGGGAEETSFANAGQMSPGYSSPWAGLGIPLKALKWLTMQHGPLAVRSKLDPAGSVGEPAEVEMRARDDVNQFRVRLSLRRRV